MRYSVLGFNQEKLIQLQTDDIKLDMTDILLMDYIQKAISQPSMLKIIKDEQAYVWLNHSKILEDLPILNIKENMLRKHISKLIQLNLIKGESISSNKGRGSRAYYTITEVFESLQNTEMTTGKKLQLVEGPPVKNYTSDNKLKKNDSNKESLSKDKDRTQKFQFGKKKEVKPTLYSKCICLIDDFTDNESLRKSLTTFLNICLENAKESGVPFYANHFKGKLNSLRALTDDNGYLNDQLAIKIVKQSLDNGWCGFYQIRVDKSKRNAARDIEHLNPEKMTHATKEQKKKFKEDIASGRAEEF
jgi:hypothetical protein